MQTHTHTHDLLAHPPSAAGASSLHPPERWLWSHGEQQLATAPLLDRLANNIEDVPTMN